MGLKDDIINKVKAITEEVFEVEQVSYTPDISNEKLTFGNKGLAFEATVLYIDMRGSTAILNTHQKRTVAKIHMAYFHAIIKIAKSLGGEVRSFNGDSVLVFFQGTSKSELSNAVKSAMKIKYMLTNSDFGVNKYLAKYSPVNFGIGIDDGKILCTKVGIKGDSNNQDLIWIGNPVNKATVLSDKAKSPNHIWISNRVYENLLDDLKFGNRDGKNLDMWVEVEISYNEQKEVCYKTSWYWEIT